MRTVPSFVSFASLAIALSSTSLAQHDARLAPSLKSDASANAELKRLSLTDMRVTRDDIDGAPGQRAALPRVQRDTGRDNAMYPPGTLVSVRDELENFPVDTSLGGTGVNAPPTSFTGPPGFQWPLNNLRGQTSVNFVRLVDLSGAPVSGPNGVTNASKALRILTGTAQPPNGFFTGANLRFGGGSPGEPTLPLEPIPGVNARISAEHWLSDIDSLYSFEPTSFTGFVAGRVLWGGTCTEATPGDCTDIGLPLGPILHFHTFNPYVWFGIFSPMVYCEDGQGSPIPDCVPHPGFNVGDRVPPPIQNWFRLAAETTADGHLLYFLDLLDGTSEAAIFDAPVLNTTRFDRVGWNASFEAQGSFMLVDNIEASGAIYFVPKPPPLVCPYLDDIEWLRTGPVLGQTQHWFAALSSAASVVDDGAGNQFLRQVNNVSSDNEFRQELSTILPSAYALPDDPWTLCLDAATTLGTSGAPTARAFAIDSELTNYIFGGVTTRVFLGITDPDTGIADSTIYVQINPHYDPTDDPTGQNPLEFPPVVGVDVVSTGAQWPADAQFRTLCITVANDNSMTIALEGVEIYSGGPGAAFSNGANLLRVESENNATGSGARLDLDNIMFDCDPLPIVSLAALVSPYHDDFDWGVDNLPPNRHVDDPANSPNTSTRFTNANGVVSLDGAITMRNVFRDTTQLAPPDPNSETAFIFTQFTSRTPSIVVDDATGWRIDMTLTLSDFLTSRGFSPAQLPDVGSGFELVGYLWISAVDQKVYLFAHPDNATPDDDLITIDTGFTLNALGVTPGAPFTARSEYNRATGLIDWSINSIALGSTNPIVGTDDQGDPRIHRNLDAIFVWGGDDDTAPASPPYSTMTLDDLRVRALTPCADANGDNVVTFVDLNAVLSSFGETGAGLPADFNSDGVVDFADLNAALAAFGTSCE